MTDELWKIPDLLNGALPKTFMPEVRMPRREGDCPAAPVCEAIGNLRNACVAGASFPASERGSDICMSSVILLIGRALRMWPKEMIDQVEEKRRQIGFQPTQPDEP